MKHYEPNDRTLADFFRQTAMLLHSGLRLDDAVAVLAEEEAEPQSREILKKIAADLENGNPLNVALTKAEFLPPHSIALIQTAEEVGRTEEILSALARHYEAKDRRHRHLIRSVSYPLVLFLIMLTVAGLLLVKVFPIFNQVYASLGASLTGISAALLRIGSAVGAVLPYLGVLFGALLLFGGAIMLLPSGKRRFQRLFSRLFGDRGAMKKTNNAFFIRNLSMILKSGAPLSEGLYTVQSLLKEENGFYRRYREATDRLEKGESLSAVLKDLEFIDLAACRLIAVAEKTGNTDEAMASLSERMDEEAEEEMEERVGKIELSMVLLMSALVGAILFSAMLPLIDIMKTFG